MVTILLEVGSKTSAISNSGETLLHLATREGYEAVVKLMIEKGEANIEAANDFSETPLHIAIGRGHTGVVQLLPDKGANSMATNNRKETPLHYAAVAAQLDIVTITRLLQNSSNCNIEFVDDTGATPRSQSRERLCH